MGNVKAVSYSIRAVYPGDAERFSWMIQWQDLEYRLCDFMKHFQSKFSTVPFPRGAIALWDRSTLIKCLRAHDTVFYGEDLKVRTTEPTVLVLFSAFTVLREPIRFYNSVGIVDATEWI